MVDDKGNVDGAQQQREDAEDGDSNGGAGVRRWVNAFGSIAEAFGAGISRNLRVTTNVTNPDVRVNGAIPPWVVPAVAAGGVLYLVSRK